MKTSAITQAVASAHSLPADRDALVIRLHDALTSEAAAGESAWLVHCMLSALYGMTDKEIVSACKDAHAIAYGGIGADGEILSPADVSEECAQEWQKAAGRIYKRASRLRAVQAAGLQVFSEEGALLVSSYDAEQYGADGKRKAPKQRGATGPRAGKSANSGASGTGAGVGNDADNPADTRKPSDIANEAEEKRNTVIRALAILADDGNAALLAEYGEKLQDLAKAFARQKLINAAAKAGTVGKRSKAAQPAQAAA